MRKPIWFRRLILLDKMIENCIYSRACGDCICDICHRKYYDHPNYVIWLTLLCSGELVHL